MSRSCYSEDGDGWELIRWRGAVASAIKGKRGQAFLREMLIALDALPEKRLIDGELEKDGEVCALGSVGRARNLDMSTIDPEDYDAVSVAFGIPQALAREIESINDDDFSWGDVSPEKRYKTVRAWLVAKIRQH